MRIPWSINKGLLSLIVNISCRRVHLILVFLLLQVHLFQCRNNELRQLFKDDRSEEKLKFDKLDPHNLHLPSWVNGDIYLDLLLVLLNFAIGLGKLLLSNHVWQLMIECIVRGDLINTVDVAKHHLLIPGNGVLIMQYEE